VNPSNVRGGSASTASTLRHNGSLSAASYRAYSSLRDTTTTSSESSTAAAGRSGQQHSMVSRYLRGSSTSPPSTAASRYSSSEGNSEASSRKISPPSGSIVSRYTRNNNNNGDAVTKSYLPDSPPSYEKILKDGGSSHYAGRSSYLREEALRETKNPPLAPAVRKTGAAAVPAAPGMYENDADREGLRQMLSSLRKDPMEVEDDPDNNDGSFFPCEFCGDPYPSEFIMRHQVR
jgi:hypothetical protein